MKELTNDKSRIRANGFTIVELLIVIVVIAILAAISIVAYNGIQERARDSQRKSDLSAIAKAMSLYKVDHGGFPSTAYGCSSGIGGSGSGWFNVVYSGTAKSVGKCLVDDGKLSEELKDEQITGCTGATADTCHAYMVCVSGNGNDAFIMANLETQAQSSSATDSTCATTYDSSYGMNYVVKVN